MSLLMKSRNIHLGGNNYLRVKQIGNCRLVSSSLDVCRRCNYYTVVLCIDYDHADGVVSSSGETLRVALKNLIDVCEVRLKNYFLDLDLARQLSYSSIIFEYFRFIKQTEQLLEIKKHPCNCCGKRYDISKLVSDKLMHGFLCNTCYSEEYSMYLPYLEEPKKRSWPQFFYSKSR